MIYLFLFIVALLLEVTSIIMILKSKHMLHSVLFLSFLFVLNSAIFAMLNQPLLALAQLFIMVGGVSVFMFVGVATESKNHTLNNIPLFVVLWLSLALLMLAPLFFTHTAISSTQLATLPSNSIAVQNLGTSNSIAASTSSTSNSIQSSIQSSAAQLNPELIASSLAFQSYSFYLMFASVFLIAIGSALLFVKLRAANAN
ncbi:MAG: NADH-quinone oxidoreductase subunit J [Candidatus Micrarchaeia archaeon]